MPLPRPTPRRKTPPYNAAADQVEEGTVQVTFDADAAQKLVAQAQPGQEITVPAQIQQPKVSKAVLEKVLFRDVLASCTTYVSGAWGRIQNVRKAAQNISGTVLNCGDQFSYNDAIGPTTVDYGFYAAPGYVGGARRWMLRRLCARCLDPVLRHPEGRSGDRHALLPPVRPRLHQVGVRRHGIRRLPGFYLRQQPTTPSRSSPIGTTTT